jgi:hypothetical protein
MTDCAIGRDGIKDVDNAMRSCVKFLGHPSDREIGAVEEPNLWAKLLGRLGSSGDTDETQNTTISVSSGPQKWQSKQELFELFPLLYLEFIRDM